MITADLILVFMNQIFGPQLFGSIFLFIVLIISIIIFYKGSTDSQNKIVGVIFISGLAIVADNESVYLFGLVIIGTLVTGIDNMIKFIQAIKTSTNENINKNTDSLKIEYKLPNNK